MADFTNKKGKRSKYARQNAFAGGVTSRNSRNLAVPHNPRRFGNQ
ncbi:hypothetical protein J21TS7_63340 [Paenibacillus cineris]|uniref:Uncharacterized protein n=1 Tax=Paenibacillus cineris TaxID=237530 RepID=A0ABQ4LND1_9BACL|nr:hypothetical protein J21TS7_63340 [Paenibacillus cineris]